MAGGQQGAAEWYATYGPAVYRRCLKLLRDREAARDATQDVFMKLVTHIDRFDDPETVLPWIYRVATNHCLNALRSSSRAGRPVPVEELELAPQHGVEPVLPTRTLAQSVLSSFDEGTQAVAVGVLVDGMEHEELAKVLGISRKTVQRRLERFITGARALLSGGES